MLRIVPTALLSVQRDVLYAKPSVMETISSKPLPSVGMPSFDFIVLVFM
jgi:hypothetical protein